MTFFLYNHDNKEVKIVEITCTTNTYQKHAYKYLQNQNDVDIIEIIIKHFIKHEFCDSVI